MANSEIDKPGLAGQVAVITGGSGVLCSEMCRGFAALGIRVAILDINLDAAECLAAEIRASGQEATAYAVNVLDKSSLEKARDQILETYGQVDILVNGAGGNKPQATTSADQTFFDLPSEAIRWVFELNLLGIILPSQVFGAVMARQKHGNIVNISSMNSFRPLTRIPAYSAAKAGVSNFTQWLAVYMAQECSPAIRVNAIAPGFFMTNQNRYLLTDKESGELTQRGNQILSHTPMGRFGKPQDLMGTLEWLISPASEFVTGIVIPIDGGFSAYSGV